MLQGKRKRKLDWDEEEEVDTVDEPVAAEEPPVEPEPPAPEPVKLNTEARISLRETYLRQRQEQKLAELAASLEDKSSPNYDKNLALYNKLKQVLSRGGEVKTYSMAANDPQSRSEKKLLLTNTRSDDAIKLKLWEQKQLERVGPTVSDDRIQVPGLEKYEFVFDQLQFVDFKAEDTIEGNEEDDEPAPQPAKRDIQEVRRLLPVYKYRDTFIEAVNANPVLIVVGETGSGKTTQLPQYLHEAGYSKDGKMIACTQPRRVAATSVAARVADEMDTKLGLRVGYTVRFDDNSNDDTILKYMTDGILLREFLMDPLLSRYGAIMIDEAHERTISTEILLSLLKDIIKERSDLKLIVASATINADKFASYFGGAPILNIPGRRFPVEVHYTLAPEANYIQAALTLIFQIHLTQPLPGDILVFLTGQDEIEQMEQALEEAREKLRDNDDVPELQVCSIYANLPPELQARIFDRTPNGARKVVLATNIAETSITIDGITHVIDPGYVKQNVYSPATGMDSLVVVPCSRASADQRAGRAGRVAPGKCFRLFTKWAYHHELEVNPVPEILRTNMVSTVLLLLSLGITDLIHFDFMDRPLVESIQKSLELLYALGALNSTGHLTATGIKMAEFPLLPNLCKCLLTASKLECLLSIVSMVAMLGESGQLFYRPKAHKEAADNAHKRFHHPRGDHFMLLTIWDEWNLSGCSKTWCQDHFVQYKTLKRAKDIRKQIAGLCNKIGLGVGKPDDWLDGPDTVAREELEGFMEKALVSGFFPNIVRLLAMGDSYKPLRLKGAVPVSIHPLSCIYPLKPPPKWLLYYELVLTSKEYMRNCMIISDPKVVQDYGGHYYLAEAFR